MHEHIMINCINAFYSDPQTKEDIENASKPICLENLHWLQYHQVMHKDNLVMDNLDVAAKEINLFKEVGGGALVDVSTVGIRLGDHAQNLATLSEQTGVQIVMGAGIYVAKVHPDWIGSSSIDELGEFIRKEVQEGIGGSSVKAGIIGEIGCTWPLEDNEVKVLRAAARAQKMTGAAITIHPGRNPAAPFKILDILVEEGADPGRVVMGHLERTIYTADEMLALAARGCIMEFDLFGLESSFYPFNKSKYMPSDEQRIQWVVQLVQAGYRDRIVLAHDVYTKVRLVTYGGHGFGHVLKHIQPRLLARGLSEEDLDRIFVQTPRRILTIAPL